MPSEYDIPLFGARADTLLGWLNEAVAEGEIWLRAQKPTTEWDKVMEVLGPDFAGGGKAIVGQSNTGYNKVRQEYKEVRATLSNFKHVGEFVPTEDDTQELFDRAHLLTNLDRHWERTSFAGLTIRDGVGYALAKGTGYFYEDWDRGALGPDRGDVRLQAYDPADVTFIQLPKSHDIQQAYVVLIRQELPLQLARRMYANNPAFANNLRADRESPGWITKGLQRVQQFISPALRAAGSTRKANESFPTVDVWHAYTIDGSINDGPEPKRMGAYGTNWEYTVPTLGSPIPQGILNPKTGEQWTLPATPEDCLLFPLRRLTIFSRTGIAYDGSSPWWHGAVPLARLRFNDLPWECLGSSQMGDATTMQDGVVNLMRLVEDSAAARLDPAMGYDDTRVDKTWAEAVNPRKAGVRFGYDGAQGLPMVPLLQPQYYDVPAWIVGEGGFIRQQEDRMDYVTAARDLVAVAKARQIPAADTMEKLLEMAGPIVQDMVGALVKPLTELGEWRKALYLQFYTRPRMIRIADPDATEMLTNAKYLPEKLIPYNSQETADARAARSRTYLGEFRYEVTESGINELNRMSRLLLYVQLAKSNVLPISWWTMAKVARVPNFGPPPAGTNTEMERWIAQQHIMQDLQQQAADEAAQAAAAAGGQPGAEGGAAPPNGNGGGGQAGRPPSYAKPPHIVQKDGGTRSTIATS